MKEEKKEIKKEIKIRTIGYLTTAFGIVAGLAWNDAVKALIDYVFPLNKDSIIAKFAYALAITIVIVIITASLLKISREEKNE